MSILVKSSLEFSISSQHQSIFESDLHLVLAVFNKLVTQAFPFRYKTTTVYFGQFQSANAADTTSRAREIRERTVPMGQPSTAPTDS